MLENKEEKGFKYIFRKYFGSTEAAVFFLLFGAVSYIAELSALAVVVFASAFVLTLLFCKDVKNIFAYLFYIPYFIADSASSEKIWVLYVFCIAAGAASVIAFVISKVVIEDKKIEKGGLFYPWIAFSLAMLTGGLIGRFNILAFAAIAFLSAEILFLYIIALYFTENLSEFLAKIFTVGGILIAVEGVCAYVKAGQFWIIGEYLDISFFSAESFNTAAIFITLGLAGCFYLGVGKKKDYLYAALSVFMFFCVVYSRCRMMILVAAVILVVEFVLFVVRSEKKINFLWLALFVIAVAGAIAVALRTEIKEIFEQLISKNYKGTNGRSLLWPWCMEKFEEYPYFGYGFVGDNVPTVRDTIVPLVLAHNTLLQWLTSTGIIGLSLAAYFYLGKYSTLFRNFNSEKIFHAVCVLAIALSGITDQAATMDVFVVITPFIVIAASEREGGKKGFVSDSF